MGADLTSVASKKKNERKQTLFFQVPHPLINENFLS